MATTTLRALKHDTGYLDKYPRRPVCQGFCNAQPREVSNV